ncbi:hypothetical protein [Paenibacillus lutrae]|uniref:DUF6199 domain-containing protein n=1 Tax=Paenibacillus lutrae TaxID=2078573 RepID=A0A7X3K1R5_9BACL|nr:hypothetical protein [Paenibacillus lutrae]MVP02574.1 hypothetical protein [Paenibacillus lutrae]
MGDKLLFALFVLPGISWGIVSIMNPEFSFKYTKGSSKREERPLKLYLINIRISGIISIIFCAYLLYMLFSDQFGI